MTALSSIRGDASRTVGVEDTCNTDVDTVLAMEPVCQGLGDTLTFIVACTGTDGVNMPPARTSSGRQRGRCKEGTD